MPFGVNPQTCLGQKTMAITLRSKLGQDGLLQFSLIQCLEKGRFKQVSRLLIQKKYLTLNNLTSNV